MAIKKKKPKKKIGPDRISVGKVQEVFNRYIRNRDSDMGYFDCMSCGRTLPVSKMNAGHFVPVKMSSFLRLHEWNVNGECAGCNGFDQMHLIGYEKRLREKIGDSAVDWLIENKRTKKSWSQSELWEIYNKYK